MKQKLKLEYLPIRQVEPYAGNPRTHSKAQVRQIARSIEAFGFINPVLIDEAGQLVAGHGRLLAARELGLKHIPAIRISHLSETERRAYLLADNKLAENAGWEPELLRVELTYLSRLELEFDVELTGFAMPEIDMALGGATQAAEPEPPAPEPDDESPPVVQPGDLWQLGPHRILCGDCREPSVLSRLMGDHRARLVLTDPPYNVPIDGHARGKGRSRHRDFAMASGELSAEAFTEFQRQALAGMAKACRRGALFYVFMDWRHMGELLAAGRESVGELLNLCVWNKTAGGMGSLYRSKHELVFLFRKGRAPSVNNVQLGQWGRNRTNVWDYPGVNTFGAGRDEALAIHPTVKPVAMLADAILDASRRGEIVLDGFLGSGSTLLAAHRTGRICHGIELDPRYVEVCLRRWLGETGEQPVHVDSGKTYGQLLKASRPIHSRRKPRGGAA